MRILFAAIVCAAAFAAAPAHACTPIIFNKLDLPDGGVVRQMVDRAASIELVRAGARERVRRADRTHERDIYLNQFELIETLKGPPGPPLRLYGDDPFNLTDEPLFRGYYDWNDMYLVVWADPARPRRWSTLSEIAFLKWEDQPIPSKLGEGLGNCMRAYAFVPGATYLVFRTAGGAILREGFYSAAPAWAQSDAPWPHYGPAVERIFGEGDELLRETRAALADPAYDRARVVITERGGPDRPPPQD